MTYLKIFENVNEITLNIVMIHVRRDILPSSPLNTKQKDVKSLTESFQKGNS